jgi:hypothetical protein
MTAALTGEIAFLLFLIAILDHPFRGDLTVRPEALLEIVEWVQKLPAER